MPGGGAVLGAHQHGKSRVRVARVWREPGGVQHFAEWTVATMLESAMEHAYERGSNEGMTATDTQKNTVYHVAQKMPSRCAPEVFGLALARHFLEHYPLISRVKVTVQQQPFVRHTDGATGKAHDHGFVRAGAEVRTAHVAVGRTDGDVEVTSGVEGLVVLKTTQSGYEGFIHDSFTSLPDTRERLFATSVTAKWRYDTAPSCWNGAYGRSREAILRGFFGPPKGGVYSPSVQKTLFEMGQLAIESSRDGLCEIKFDMPNIHFIPCSPLNSKFEDDVYFATSEPHGQIEASVTRADVRARARL